jgi:hypothetical protein
MTQTHIALVYTNVSARPCLLSGWPSVVAVQKNGVRSVTRRVGADSMGPELNRPVRRSDLSVLLRPHASAYSLVGAAAIGLTSNTCRRDVALEVTPPGGRTAVSLPVRGVQACGEISVTRVLSPAVVHTPYH